MREEELSDKNVSTSFVASWAKFNIREWASTCFIFSQILLIIFSGMFWGPNVIFAVSIVNKVAQVFAAAVGLYAIPKVIKHRVFQYLLLFDSAYLLTCVLNDNMVGNLKVFIHFFILQGLFFYSGYIGDFRISKVLKKSIVIFATFAAVLNNLFIFLPIGIPGYVIGYHHFGKNFGFFPVASTGVAMMNALTCIISMYEYGEKKRIKNIIIFVLNYIAVISSATRTIYIVLSVAMGIIAALKLNMNYKLKNDFRRICCFVFVTAMVGFLTLECGKFQPAVCSFSGNHFDGIIRVIAHDIDEVLSDKGKPYMITNGGTGEIIVNKWIASGSEVIGGDIREITDIGSLNERRKMWHAAIDTWKNHNILFGCGRENLGKYSIEMGHTVIPIDGSSHSSWLNIICWSGIVGGAIFAMFVFEVIRRAKRNIHTKALPLAIVIGFIINMVMNPGGIYTAEVLSIVLWNCLGVLCGLDNSFEKQTVRII